MLRPFENHINPALLKLEGTSELPGRCVKMQTAGPTLRPEFVVRGGWRKELEFLCFFQIFCLFIFRERGRERERGEKHQCVVASFSLPTGNLA